MTHPQRNAQREPAVHEGGRSARDVEILARVGRSLLRAVDLDEQLGLTLGLAVEALGADRGSVMMADREAGEMEVSAASGLPPDALGARVPLSQGIAGWVALHNEPLILHGDLTDPRFPGTDPTIESALALPLAVDATVLGVLNVVRKAGGRFTDGDLRLAEGLADLASLAIEKARLYAALREREERVSDLLGAAIRAQEQERRRIAADIHDGFLQDLTALFLKAEMAKMQFTRGMTDEATRTLESMQDMVRSEMEAMRSFIFQVRPPSLDEVGLGPTLKAMIELTAAEHHLDGSLLDRSGPGRLPETLESILYRIAQEAIRNVVKHAKARRFWVVLEQQERKVLLSVRDDGRGIQVEERRAPKVRHYGIDTMRERAELAGGHFFIGPVDRGGTEVRALIPLDTARPGGPPGPSEP